MSRKYVIRYGLMQQLGEYGCKGPRQFFRGNQVIVRSHRGTEWGEVLCEATERTRDYLSHKDTVGKILRQATPEDERTRDDVWAKEREAFGGCRDLIGEHHLAMQLIDAEHLFGGERLIFYYLSETRVDFRELVKSLAKKFTTRIEMRHVGIRDEAKLLADYGDCGKPVCCNTHLQEMPPVSMKMAKLQKATLDPTKISGRCGRLKCCLRYEYDTYAQYQRELPKVGKTVITRQGQGKVLSQEILSQRIQVLLEDNRRLTIDAADVITVVGGQGPRKKEGQNLACAPSDSDENDSIAEEM